MPAGTAPPVRLWVTSTASVACVERARWYWAAQAAGGLAWWVAVATVPSVRLLTLGSLDPVLVAALDVPLFVVGSALAAAGVRWAAVVATCWTLVVTVGLLTWATVTREAGWGVLIMVAAVGRVAARARRRPARPRADGVGDGRSARLPDGGPRRGSPSQRPRHDAADRRLLGPVPRRDPARARRARGPLGLRAALPADVRLVVAVVGVVVLALASTLGIASARRCRRRATARRPAALASANRWWSRGRTGACGTRWRSRASPRARPSGWSSGRGRSWCTRSPVPWSGTASSGRSRRPTCPSASGTGSDATPRPCGAGYRAGRCRRRRRSRSGRGAGVGPRRVPPDRAGQAPAPLTFTSQVTPWRSVSMPKVSPHGAVVSGSMTVAPSDRPSQ